MPRILVSASFTESLLARQTPQGQGKWDEFEFVFSPLRDAVDGWTVYDDLRQPIEQACPPANTLLITGEPESLRKYRPRFTGQFGQVWTSHSSLKHTHVTLRNEAQPWHYAMRSGQSHGMPLGFNELVRLPKPDKPKLLSVICSSKTSTPDHAQRLEFVRFLQSQLGDSIDVFGRGIRPVEDKSDAIWPYKYHIVLENDHSNYFMTEKISDAFLGWSYPIYFGSPEAYHRFPEGSFTAIDIYQPEPSLAIIRDLIAAETYEAAQDNLARARQAVLFKNNVFAMLSDYWRANLCSQPAELVTLLPKSHRASLVLRQVGRAVNWPFSRRVA